MFSGNLQSRSIWNAVPGFVSRFDFEVPVEAAVISTVNCSIVEVAEPYQGQKGMKVFNR